MHRDWAPLGADRFYNLVKNGFYDDVRFFRVVDGFMVQFGMNGDPAIQRRGANAQPQGRSGQAEQQDAATSRSRTPGPNSRTTQVFINFEDNAQPRRQGFAPFGEVIAGHGRRRQDLQRLRRRHAADQGRSQRSAEGNAYLKKDFPKLDYVKKATIEK